MSFVTYLAFVPFFLLALVLAYPLKIVVVLAAWLRHIRALRVRLLAEAEYRKITKAFLTKHGCADVRLVREVLREHKQAVVSRLMSKCAQELPALPWWVREF
jgi:hypothetical protein